MYADHVPVISDYARNEAQGFFRVAMFAVCSIRQPIVQVPSQLRDVMDRGGLSSALFGHKRPAFYHLERHKTDMLRRILAASNNFDRIMIVAETPGIGIVKAGFVLQLMGYDVACLDSRNVKREGRNPHAFATYGKPPTKNKVTQYLAETEGRAQEYWDLWCEDVAQSRGSTAQEVSALHLAVLPDECPF